MPVGPKCHPVNREFFINIVFLVFINLLIKPFYIFGIDRTVQNTVETGSYGLYFALFNFTFLFQIINDFGIQNFNNRNIAQHRQLLGKYFPNILVLKGLLGILFLAALIPAAILLGYDRAYFPLLLLIAFNQILASGVLFLRSNISGLAMYRIDSALSALDKLAMILLVGILLWTPVLRERFRIEWFVYAQTASFAITAFVAFVILRRHTGRLRFRFQPAFLWLILKKSYPYAIVIFLMTAYTRIDGVMIERLLSDGKLEADLYASAYRLLDASNMIGFMFAGLLLPMFARQIKDKQPVGELVRFSFQIIWAGAIPLAVASWFFREEIMVLLYDHGGAYSGRIMGFLMLSFVAVAGSYIYGTLLTASGRLVKMNAIFLSGVILNVGLNLWLIPSQKALGAAVATCVTQFLVFFAQVLLARKEFSLGPAVAMIARITAFFTFTAFSAFAIYHYLYLAWPARFSLCLAVGIALSFIFKMLNLRELTRLIRYQ